MATFDDLNPATSVDRLQAAVPVNEGEGLARDTLRLSPDVMDRYRVPTATQLSNPGALQAYIEERIGGFTVGSPGGVSDDPIDGHFGGPILLPRGIIELGTADANALRLISKQGFTVMGVGEAGNATNNLNLTRTGDHHFTLIRFSGSPSVPLLELQGVEATHWMNLGFEHASGGTCVFHSTGVGNRRNHFTGCSFAGNGFDGSEEGGVGVEYGPGNNNSDSCLHACHFMQLRTGVVLNSAQNLEFLFSGCDWLSCETGIWAKGGGGFHVEMAGMVSHFKGRKDFPHTFLRIGEGAGNLGGGGNASPITISNLRIDGSGVDNRGRREEVAVDLSGAGHMIVGVDGFCVQGTSEAEGGDLGRPAFWSMFRYSRSRIESFAQRINVTNTTNCALSAHCVRNKLPNPAYNPAIADNITTNSPYIDTTVNDPDTGVKATGDDTWRQYGAYDDNGNLSAIVFGNPYETRQVVNI